MIIPVTRFLLHPLIYNTLFISSLFVINWLSRSNGFSFFIITLVKLSKLTLSAILLFFWPVWTLSLVMCITDNLTVIRIENSAFNPSVPNDRLLDYIIVVVVKFEDLYVIHLAVGEEAIHDVFSACLLICIMMIIILLIIFYLISWRARVARATRAWRQYHRQRWLLKFPPTKYFLIITSIILERIRYLFFARLIAHA